MITKEIKRIYNNILASDFTKIYYSTSFHAIVGTPANRGYWDGQCLGSLSYSDFCELFFMLIQNGWQDSKTSEANFVILSK